MKSASGTPAACASRSIRRRITYSLRSNSSSPAGAAFDEQLAHHRLAGAGQLADRARIDGHVAEAERAVALLGAHPHAQLFAAQPQRRVARQEHEPGAVATGLGQPAEQRLGLAPQEPVGQLHHDSGAVAGVRIGAGGAAVFEARAAHGWPVASSSCVCWPSSRTSAPSPHDACSKRPSHRGGIVLPSGCIRSA